ncbi:MAG: RNA pyrophosphohydrolase [Pseudomonadota bacterium]
MTAKPSRRETLPYRPCVGVAVFNRDGHVWVGKRVDDHGGEHVDATHAWQMPQGGIDKGEAPIDAAWRELFEETHIKSASLLAEAPDWYNYDIPHARTRRWRQRYRGQTQRWFAFLFEGDEAEIDISGHEGGEREFVDWAWRPIEELPGLIIPFKRPVYEQVVTAFAHLPEQIRKP